MQVWPVRQVAAYLREIFDSDPVLADIWIEGECSNVSKPSSGHVYFTLKDDTAAVRCAFFAKRMAPSSATARLVENGSAVIAHGRFGLYEQRGDLQFYVDFVQDEGTGALQAEFERLKARLEEEGLFDAARKRQLPRFPRTVGVVTSGTGAAFRDICNVLQRRWPVAEIVLAPAPVQGPDAVSGIVGGIQQLNSRGDIDVMIVGRGGGSVEELWAFNEEPVARAIFASGVPVISAVGHETDTSISDYVADVRAPTPSAAAEIVAPDRFDVSVRLGVAAGTMTSVLRDALASGRAGIVNGVRTMERRLPDVNRDRQRVDDLIRRTSATVDHAVRQSTSSVGNCVWRLKALDPFATLERGYAIVQKNGGIVSSVDDVRGGDALDVRLKDGSFGAFAGGGQPKLQKRRPKRVPDAQAPLFSMPEERA
jgi:exodeoxyribonuclease VII large subunit